MKLSKRTVTVDINKRFTAMKLRQNELQDVWKVYDAISGLIGYAYTPRPAEYSASEIENDALYFVSSWQKEE